MATGTVKSFNDSNGYGFIAPDEGGEDLYVHRNSLFGLSLAENDRVEFETTDSETGPEARNVTLVSG
jgi:CspA family cold shock protein